MMVPLIRRVIETIFSLTCFSAAIGIGLAASITDADVNNTTLPAHSYLLLGTCQSDIASFKRKYDHTLWCPPWETNVTYNHYADYQLHVIYFLNTKIHNGYGGWMKEQLKYVPPSAALKIVSVAYDCENETIMQGMYRHLVASRNGSTLLECHDEAERETFEYHGIHAMWEIGQVNSGRDDIVFYFHSKGLTHYKEWKDYEANDNLFKLTEKTLGEVDLVFEVFDLFPEVDKVGNKMSELGWVWYNFMFARGSYLKRVAEPIISSNRHYYEAWIANVDGKRLGDGYSHHADNSYKKHRIPNMGTYYSPADGTWNRWDDKEWKVPNPSPVLPRHSGLLFTCISFCTVCLVIRFLQVVTRTLKRRDKKHHWV